MLDILKKLEEETVSRSNNLRFKCSEMFDFILSNKSFTTVEKVFYLKLIFGWGLYTCKKVVDEVLDGASFIDITNELDAQGKLR